MIQKVKKLTLGGHLRASEGLTKVALGVRALKYDAVQIMIGGGTDWNPYQISEKMALDYRAMTYGVSTYVHLPYLINPCVPPGRKRGFGKATLLKYAKASEGVAAKAMVLHPGFKQERTEDEAYDAALKFLTGYLSTSSTTIKLLLETDAGSKNESAIGSIGFIEALLNDLRDDRMGVCLDTTHLYARGTDLWDPQEREKFIDIYGERVDLVHFNIPDPDVELGSHRDRHNSPIKSFKHNSDLLIARLAHFWPLILERSSVAVQQEDAEYIRGLLAVPEMDNPDQQGI